MECMTLAEIFATTIFSVKLMHDCISLGEYSEIIFKLSMAAWIGVKA